MIDGIRIRTTRSRDIRAPNIGEYFNPQLSSLAAIRDPQRGNIAYQVTPIIGGNPDLQPERSDTTTLGLVFNPAWAGVISASVDAFDIKIAGAIASLTSQQILDRCVAGITSLCALIERDPASGLVTRVLTQKVNLSALKTRGIDFELGYRGSVGWFGDAGKIAVRAFATYIDRLVTETPGAAPQDVAGEVNVTNGGTPHWRGLLSAQYSDAVWTVELIENYRGGGVYDNALKTFLPKKYPGQAWTDVLVRRNIGTSSCSARSRICSTRTRRAFRAWRRAAAFRPTCGSIPGWDAIS